MEPTGRSERVTRLVADWAANDPVHGVRLADAAQRGPEVLERAVYHLLRSSGGPGSTVKRLRQTLTAADLELVDWVTVTRLLLSP